MRARHILVALLGAFLATLPAAFAAAPPAAAEDIAGARDHPLVGRYEGSRILGYDYQEFDVYPFPAAAGPDGFQEIEGRVTRISYVIPEQVSPTAIARNVEAALAERGFETVLACETRDCGGISYDLDQFPLPRMIVDRFDYRVLAARLARPEEGDVYATVIVSPDGQGQVRVMLGVVETAPLELRMIDAAEMARAVGETGRVALYGITFDTDSAAIRPESAATLAEMAAFLQAEPGREVVIVGHTDNQGSLEYNLGLSHRRAEAVREALATAHGIAPARMLFAGAGFLAPVAPNTTEEGRALNRRVEIIAR
ncbi:MAG: OmpA family protein [Salinarimonas sp.]